MVISGISGQFGFAGTEKKTPKNFFYEKNAVSREFCMRIEARIVKEKVAQCRERSVSLALFVDFQLSELLQRRKSFCFS